MNPANPSVREVEARIEAELAYHSDKARVHREKMQEHSEKSAHHSAEARRLEEDLKNFRTVVARWLPKSDERDAPIEQSATSSGVPEQEPPHVRPEGANSGEPREHPDEAVDRMPVSLAVAQTVDMAMGDKEVFDMTYTAQMANALFKERLGGPVDPKQVSNVLRRMLAEGKIFLVREGRPRYPAEYSKTPQTKEENNADTTE